MTTITGDMIVEYRKQHKLSRRAFADMCGLTQAKIHNIEHGRAPKPDELEAIKRVIGEDGETPPSDQGVWGTAEDVADYRGIGDDLVHVIRMTNATGNITRCGLTVDQAHSTAWESEATCPTCKNVQVEQVPGWEQLLFTMDEPEDDEGVVLVEDAMLPFHPADEPRDIFDTNARLFSNSEIQTYKRCKRKWWLGWYRHLRLKQERPTGARVIGTWVHEALAVKYDADADPGLDIVQVINHILARELARYEEILAEHVSSDQDGGFDSERLRQLMLRDQDLARAMIEGYVDWVAETGADEGLTMLGSETYIQRDLFHQDGVPVKIIGKLDARMHRRQDDTRFYMDHKTVGDFMSATKQLAQNQQMLHYLYLEQAQEDERPVVGAYYNMLRKVKRSATAKPPFYQRVEVRHNPQELDSYEEHLHGTVMEILATESQLNGMHEDDYGHHRLVPPTPARDCDFMCDFYAVCPMFDDGSRAEDLLSQFFRRGEHLDYYRITTDEKVKDA